MNWGILGHEWAVNLLREHIAQDNLRHAYLFTGPSGVGRRTLALRLAQALNCSQPPAPGEPCQSCRTCLQIERMQYPDLAIVQAEQQAGTLKVDQIRALQHHLALAPYEAKYRVTLLLRFEEANPSAANALLKTLEEPPAQVVLVLTASSAEALLPTIVSRCEVLRLRPLPLEQLSQGLQALWAVPPERADLLAHISAGRPGYALRMHLEPEYLERRNIWLDDHQRLLNANRVERFAYAENLAKEKEMLREALGTWLSLWRDVLLKAAGSSALLANPDREEQVGKLAVQVGLETTRCTLSALERTLDLIDRNVNSRLATEVLLLDLPSLSNY